VNPSRDPVVHYFNWEVSVHWVRMRGFQFRVSQRRACPVAVALKTTTAVFNLSCLFWLTATDKLRSRACVIEAEGKDKGICNKTVLQILKETFSMSTRRSR
jgi:hypothetical protein